MLARTRGDDLMPAGQLLASTLLILVGGYIIYRTVTLRNAEKQLRRVTRAAEAHNGRIDEAVAVSLENISAVKENTQALREQTTVLRQLLEKQGQVNK